MPVASITVHPSQQAAKIWAGAMSQQGHQVIDIKGPFAAVKIDSHLKVPPQDHGYINGDECWIVLIAAG